MSNRFRNAVISGFNRSDVVNYVSSQSHEKESLKETIVQLEQTISQLRQDLEKANALNADLEEQLAASRQENYNCKNQLDSISATAHTMLEQLDALRVQGSVSNADNEDGTL